MRTKWNVCDNKSRIWSTIRFVYGRGRIATLKVVYGKLVVRCHFGTSRADEVKTHRPVEIGAKSLSDTNRNK